MVPTGCRSINGFPILQSGGAKTLLSRTTFCAGTSRSTFPTAGRRVRDLLLPGPRTTRSRLSSSEISCFCFVGGGSRKLMSVRKGAVVPLATGRTVLPPSSGVLELTGIRGGRVTGTCCSLSTRIVIEVSSSRGKGFKTFDRGLTPISLSSRLFFVSGGKGGIVNNLSGTFLDGRKCQIMRGKSTFNTVSSAKTIIVPVRCAGSLADIGGKHLKMRGGTS